MKKVVTVDEYIAGAPESVRDILQTIRKTIKEEVPEVVETISYQMPAYKLNGKFIVYFAAFKDHISIFPATSAMTVPAEILKYKKGKGTFQFPLKDPIPWTIIRKIIRIRKNDMVNIVAQKQDKAK